MLLPGVEWQGFILVRSLTKAGKEKWRDSFACVHNSRDNPRLQLYHTFDEAHMMIESTGGDVPVSTAIKAHLVAGVELVYAASRYYPLPHILPVTVGFLCAALHIVCGATSSDLGISTHPHPGRQMMQLCMDLAGFTAPNPLVFRYTPPAKTNPIVCLSIAAVSCERMLQRPAARRRRVQGGGWEDSAECRYLRPLHSRR